MHVLPKSGYCCPSLGMVEIHVDYFMNGLNPNYVL